MKKLAILLLFIIAATCVHAQTAAIPGYCSLGATQVRTSGLPSTNYAQGVIPQCTVTVYFTGTTNKATIYQDGFNTVLSNPFTANSAGQWIFWATANNAYDVVLSGGISPNTYSAPVTLTALFPSSQIIAASTPAGPAFAVNFANSLANAFQGDSAITVNPTTHTFAAPNVVLTGTGTTALPVCPNGPGGALTTSGCTGGIGANPAAPAFAVNFANSTATAFQADSTITINPATHAFVAPQIGSFLYSAQYGTGLIGAMATGKTVLTGTDDATTATNYSFTNMIPGVPSNFAWTDYRKNNQGQMNFFHNWGYIRGASFSAVPDAFQTNCLTDAPWVGGTGNTVYDCSHVTFFDSAPGLSLGNPAVNSVGNWQVGLGMQVTYNAYGAGIREVQANTLNHYGIGDTAQYTYLFSHGGAKAASDEGVENASTVTEDTVQATGTCATGCTTGSTQFKLTMGTGAGTQGVGRSIINTTVGPQANKIINVAAGLGAGIEAVTLETPVAQSVAWGTLVANMLPTFGDLASPPFGTVKTFSVNVTAGTFDTTNVFCFADQFNDQTIPTVVSGAGPVSITALVHRPHAAGAEGISGWAVRLRRRTGFVHQRRQSIPV
jgi:hypothetical protein